MTRSYLTVFVLFCTLIAVAVWMLTYGLILMLVWKDGRILHLMATSNPLSPIQQLLAYPHNRALQLVALASLVPALFISVGAAIFGLKRPSSPLGNAAFQDPSALRRDGWFGKGGHIFGRHRGRLIRRTDDRHHIVIGPTRSGKGAGYVIPNALMFPGSMIVTDLKGEIFQLTAGYRKARGHEVFLFSPGSRKSHRWNPLDFVRTERGSRTTDIQNMAAILIPETAGSENAVWQGTAQQVIAGVISYVLESPHYRNRRNLGEVNAFLNAGVDLQARLKQIKESEPDLSKFTSDSFNAYISLNERAARSALLDIQKALAPFRNERVIAATSLTDMELGSLQRRRITIYLAPNITDMTILRPLLTLFVQQMMDILTRVYNPIAVPVYFLLDEFRQLKKMDEVLNKLPYVAGYNIKMAFIVQDLNSLDEIYGKTARNSLLGNCGLQLILGANDQVTAEYAANALGKRTIHYPTETRTQERTGLLRRTRVEQIRERDLMMPQEIRQMPEDRMILLVEGQRPIFASKLRYYAVEPFKSAAARALRVDVPDLEAVPVSVEPAVLPKDPVSEAETSERKETKDQAPDTIPASSVTREMAQVIAEGLRRKSVETSGGANIAAPARLTSSAVRLQSAISASLAASPDMSARSRLSIQEIFASTVPDPIEIGLE